MLKYFKTVNVFIMFIFVILFSLGNLGMPYLIEVYTTIVYEGDASGILNAIFITIGYVIYMFLVSFFLQSTKAKVKESINKNLIGDLMNNIFNRSLKDFKRNDESYYLSLINNDARNWIDIKFNSLLDIVADGSSLIFALIYVIIINPLIAVILLVASIIFAFLPGVFTGKIQNATFKQNSELEKYNEAILEGTKNYKTLFIASGIKNYRKYFNHLFSNYITATKNFVFWSGITNSFVSLFSLIIQFLILLFVAYLTTIKVIDPKYFFTLFSLSNLIVYPIFSVSKSFVNYKSAKLIEEKIVNELNYDTINESEEKILIDDNSISINNVNFSYNEDKKIFENYNLSIDTNSNIILRGASGSGKSTLISLITKQQDCNEGIIKLGEVDISNYSLTQLNNNFTLVPATPCIFTASIKDNITLFSRNVDKDKLAKAIEIANLNSLLAKLKDKENSIIKKGVLELSDGEKQRVELARAIYKDTPILILDESTANIDRETAYDIEKRITNMTNKTIISITHRHDNQFDLLYDSIVNIT